jgi:transmembrane sensor
MNKSRLHTLLQKFKEDLISQQEWDELRTIVKSGRFDEQLDEDFLSLLNRKGDDEKWTTEIEQKIWAGIDAGKDKRSRRFIYNRWIAVAAMLLIVLTVGLVFFRSANLPADNTVNRVISKPNIVPGSDKAILTLSNGRQIVLNDSTTGQLASQAGTLIAKTGTGQLIYTVDSSGISKPEKNIEEVFNTLTIPRGGQYQVTLPDGTQVWLNSASVLKFPAIFKGKRRVVELDGEAYFAVSKNKKMPFVVHTKDQDIEVLGTHFNVNSYADESATKTTLLEGSVKIVSQANQVTLIPGQQAQTDRNSSSINVMPVRVQDAIAWKNGYFVFNDEKLESIMRRIARWYDVEYQLKDELKDLSLLGIIERSKDISSLLKILESTGSVHFKIEGRTIIVMP